MSNRYEWVLGVTNDVIQTQELTKRYGAKTALDHANFTLASGEVLGFVGPNGAGKSTLMKMLIGVVHPSSGSGEVLGLDIKTDSVAIREHVGYLPGDLGLYRNMTGKTFVKFCLSYYSRADYQRAWELCNLFELPLTQKLKNYSTGMRQQVGLVQAFSVNAEVLLLDEPTKGLDPTSQHQFMALVAEEQERGRTILLSSHALEEIERACHRVLFIDRGNFLKQQDIDEARKHFQNMIRVSLTSENEAALRSIPGVTEVSKEKDGFLVRLNGPVGPVLEALSRLNVDNLEYNRPSLLEIYQHIYLSRRKR